MLRCVDLLCEYQKSPIGIDDTKPRFSWKLESEKQNVKQTSYEIVVDNMWNSGKIDSENSLHIVYDGKPLEPMTIYHYRVRVWDNYGDNSPWTYGTFETGMMNEAWTAKWIKPAAEVTSLPALVKSFGVHSDVSKARIYTTAYGLYEIFINGKRISDHYLSPGFTSYHKRLQYQVYDVREHLSAGENKLEIYLAKGWCCGHYPLGFENVYETSMAALLQMSIEYSNGESLMICTDESWKCCNTPILFSELYDGETYDARIEDKEPEFFPVETDIRPFDNITAQEVEPVRVVKTIQPVEIITTPKGETVIDFGQNMVGWAEFTVNGLPGDKVILKHAEVLDKDGNFYTANLRSAKQTVEYILKGGTQETYHPHFSFQGFRYIKIESFPKKPQLSDFVGKVICSDIKRIGYFECSNQKINRLYQNVIWGQLGNFVDIPTDCPQRDERYGWTGDAQVFVATAAKNMNVALFFKKWLRDLKADQLENGLVPYFIPSTYEKNCAAAWGDAATICPWEIYLAYGDKEFLRAQYPSMKAWVDYLCDCGENYQIWCGTFGDWLGLDAEEGSYVGATSKEYIAMAFFAYSTSLLIKAASVLEHEDVDKYYKVYDNLLKSFKEKFVLPNGKISEKTQTAYALALRFNLINNKVEICQELAEMVRNNGNRLTTGFVGTPYLCFALAENGCQETAFDLLFQEEYPSWLYSVNKGATTIWEHWDGIKPNGDFWSTDMNSYNHYAYGSIADYLYKKCAGINLSESGYKKIVISPLLDKRLTFVKASIDTMYGIVASEWKIHDKMFSININIPVNTTADIVMPNCEIYSVGSGKYSFTCKI